jgi:hypothetical protein
LATVKSNGVEDYIDAIHLFRHGVDVLFDRVLIERIYLRDFDNASIGSDLLGDKPRSRAFPIASRTMTTCCPWFVA